MRGERPVEEPAAPAASTEERESVSYSRAQLRAIGRYAVKHPLPSQQREQRRLALSVEPDARELFEIRRAELAEQRALEEQAAHEVEIGEEI